jgi:hypothetical protein
VKERSQAKGKPGKSGPASPRFLSPRPPLRDFTIEIGKLKVKVQTIHAKPSASDSFAGRGWSADFSGASPVASALGIRLGATPCGLIHPNIHSPLCSSKQDISTLQRIGHFYFALTGNCHSVAIVSHTAGHAASEDH